jgi:RNA polymerase sigma factor (sigma-70 family)
MHDSEVAASIAAGDPRGLAVVYDRYADPLYKYCRTLLGDPADAADAVQNAFVIAASRLDELRDPGRLRAWLYAVARSEALRILRSKDGAPAPDEAPGVTDDSVDRGHHAEHADLRALLEDASDGLNPGEREAIELHLRQGLDPAEVAIVLGVSRNRARTLLARASEQLGTCLAVLLVGRVGRDCGELDSILADWDGRLTVLLRKRVHRHIEHCAICGARQASELSPAMLLDLSPGTALATGAELSLRLAPGPPEGLRAHTLTIATGPLPGAVADRAAVLGRAGAFDHSGFPKPDHGGRAGLAAHGGKAGGVTGALRSSPRGQATVAAAVVVAVAIAAVAFALTDNSGTSTSAAAPKPPVVPATAITSLAAKQTQPKPTTHATSAAPSPTALSPTAPSSAKPGQKSTLNTAAPTPTTASPTPTTPSPTPTTASPAPTPTPTPKPTQGTLSEYPQGGTAAAPAPLVLGVPNGAGAQIDLSASGSRDWDVDWSVTVANDSGGAISVSSADSGTLTSTDTTATLRVTADQFILCGSSASPTITVEPGGAVYSVCTSLL